MSRNLVQCSVCRRYVAPYGTADDPAFERVLPDGSRVWRCATHLSDGGAAAPSAPSAPFVAQEG